MPGNGTGVWGEPWKGKSSSQAPGPIGAAGAGKPTGPARGRWRQGANHPEPNEEPECIPSKVQRIKDDLWHLQGVQGSGLGNDTEYLDKPIENLKNELADLEQVERKVVPPHILLSRTQQKIRHLEAREKKLTQDRNYWDQTIQEANTKIQDANIKKQEAIDTYSDNEDRLQELRNAQKHQVEQAAGDDSNATPRCSYAPERPAFLTAEEMQLPDLFKVCLKAVCINYWPKPLALSQPGNGPRCPPPLPKEVDGIVTQETDHQHPIGLAQPPAPGAQSLPRSQ